MVNEVLTVAMLVVMAIGVFSGFPVALVLAGTGFLGFVAAVWVGITDFQHLGLIYLRARGVLTNESVQFTSVPMLIFLGLILNASGPLQPEAVPVFESVLSSFGGRMRKRSA